VATKRLVLVENTAESPVKETKIDQKVSDFIANFLWALLLTVLTLGPMLVIGILIWLQNPIVSPIFSQVRVGYQGREFVIYKFRTMHPITKKVNGFGRILRQMHLDELPQFINIMKGDMRLVGPRPLTPEDCFAWREQTRFALRFTLLPGMLGLEQLRERGRQQQNTAAYTRQLANLLAENSSFWQRRRLELWFIVVTFIVKVLRFKGSAT
jgi:lipopolysaccharide/colanic/teichoic acid biosynthesis glycosyltransferase